MIFPDFSAVWARADSIEGHLPKEDAELLYAAALSMALTKPIRFLEVGSFRGRSTVIVAGFGVPTTVIEPGYLWHDIQDPQYSRDGTPSNRWKYVDKRVDGESIRALRENTKDLPIQFHLVPTIQVNWRGAFSFMFIDGDHTEGGIDVDCQTWLPMLVSGGIAAFHDYDMPDYPFLKKTVNEFINGWSRIGQRGSLLVAVKP